MADTDTDSLVTQRIAPLCNLIKQNRFDESTLRILNTILLSSTRDPKLLPHLRQTLTQFLRSESLLAIRQASHKPIDHKLLLLDFFVRAFAILSDSQSCLALRYEALVMRDNWTNAQPDMRVLSSEWMGFAQHAFDDGFYAVAVKACEKAISSIEVEQLNDEGRFHEIKRMMDVANVLSASHPVQAQASEYLKRKTSRQESSVCHGAQRTASMSFRDGIKQKNVRNLLHLQDLQKGQSALNYQL